MSIAQATTTLAVPGFTAGFVTHAVFNGVGRLSRVFGRALSKHPHDIFQVLRLRNGKKTVPTICEFFRAVADKLAKLVRPPDYVLRMISITINDRKVPTPLCQRLPGERPRLLIFYPTILHLGRCRPFFAAMRQLGLKFKTLMLDIGQLPEQTLIVLGAARRRRHHGSLTLPLQMSVPLLAQCLKNGKQFRLTLQPHGLTDICRLFDQQALHHAGKFNGQRGCGMSEPHGDFS